MYMLKPKCKYIYLNLENDWGRYHGHGLLGFERPYIEVYKKRKKKKKWFFKGEKKYYQVYPYICKCIANKNVKLDFLKFEVLCDAFNCQFNKTVKQKQMQKTFLC